MAESPLHEQFREIWHFIHEKCEEESKLMILHAMDEPAPACEYSTAPAKFEPWEDPSGVNEELAMGLPGRDFKGDPTDQFNFCPYCKAHVWTNAYTPIGAKINCYYCGGVFGRTV